MTAYYNERDPYAAQWLRNLIAAGLIAPGDVDDRSIEEVRPDDLLGYQQCHFFAGIAGWSLALRLAGVPDDRPLWTGSCPCQPFSAAGKGKAADDERHLWPVWFSLIRECRPPIVFGEQVEAAVGWGWLDLVFADLEAEGYACGAAVLPACSVGAPHIRNRLWFVADAMPAGRPEGWSVAGDGSTAGSGGDGLLAHSAEPGRHELTLGTAVTDGRPAAQSGRLRDAGSLVGDAIGPRLEGRSRQRGDDGEELPAVERAGNEPCFMGDTSSLGRPWLGHQPAHAFAGQASPWASFQWLPCTDGKARPTQPGIFPLAHGVSARVGKLRAAGNAIVPQVAAEFIRAVM